MDGLIPALEKILGKQLSQAAVDQIELSMTMAVASAMSNCSLAVATTAEAITRATVHVADRITEKANG